ncbi:MAG: hypothetical protein H7831_00235 [Magnetococcus sp. WYHC-3]
MRHFSSMALLSLPLMLTAGCSGPLAVTDVALFDPSVREQPHGGGVRLLQEEPTTPFRRLALLITRGNDKVPSEIYLLENMRAKASEIGAQAIIVEPESSREVLDEFGQHQIQRELRGVAIRFD